MARKDEHKRQKQLAKRNKRASEVRKEMQKNRNRSLVDLIRESLRFPVRNCFEKGDQYTKSFLLIRRLADGRLILFAVMVDLVCLGVKDAFVRTDVDPDWLARQTADSVEVSPAYALKCILGGVKFAANYDFRPHPDFEQTMLGYAEADPNECKVEFEYGIDGKPCYIPGPFDDELFQDNTMRKLGALGFGGVFSCSLGTDLDGEDFDDFDEEEDGVESRDRRVIDGTILNRSFEDLSEKEADAGAIVRLDMQHEEGPKPSQPLEEDANRMMSLEEIERKF